MSFLYYSDNYDCVTEEELRQIIGLTLENSKASRAHVANITDLRSDWDIASASFVALTIITTIGKAMHSFEAKSYNILENANVLYILTFQIYY